VIGYLIDINWKEGTASGVSNIWDSETMKIQRRPTNLQYDDCTIPPGMTVREWRERKSREDRRGLRARIRCLLQRNR
jgi:hypothetical protein